MTLEERIAKLERISRRWRWVAVALLVALIITVSHAGDGGQGFPVSPNAAVAADIKPVQTHDKLRAKSLEIVNDRGQTAATIQGFGDGAQFVIRSASGQDEIKIRAMKGHCVFSLRRLDSEALIAPNLVQLLVHDAETDQEVLELNNKAAGDGGLTKADRERFSELLKKRERVSLIIGAGRGGGLEANNPFGTAVVRIGSGPDNNGLIIIGDRMGKWRRKLSSQ